jgi:heat shock protein HslJ
MAAVLAVVPLVALAACSSDSSDSSADGKGGEATSSTTQKAASSDLTANPWTLVSFTAASGAAPATTQGQDAVLQFAKDGNLSGTTGCNNFAGTYKVDGTDLTISLGPMTRRACTDPSLTAQEEALTAGLAQVTGFSLDAGTLSLTAGSDVRFTYAAEDTSLVGGWEVTGLNNGAGGLESSAGTQALAMMFEEDTVTVGGGCNTLSANYSTTGEEPLTFGPVGSTKKACEGDAAKVDQQMTDALGRTTDYEVVGGTLTLRDQDGAMQVTAKRAGS